jgi:hypothetical protein
MRATSAEASRNETASIRNGSQRAKLNSSPPSPGPMKFIDAACSA